MSSITAQAHAADYIIITMARAIRDGESVFHGAASPMPAIAIQLAKKLHATNAIYLNSPSTEVFADFGYSNYISYDASLTEGAYTKFGLSEIFNLSAKGKLDVAFLHGSQIDLYGRLNLGTTLYPSFEGENTSLTKGAGSDALLPTVNRAILWKTKHTKETFVEKLNVFAGEGNTDLVITPLAVFKNSEDSGKLQLYTVFPGLTLDYIQENTGFTLEKHPEYHAFKDITEQEASLLEELDCNGLRYSEFT